MVADVPPAVPVLLRRTDPSSSSRARCCGSMHLSSVESRALAGPM
jgi:hypothetical protein